MENRKFNLDDYETVEARLEKFWKKYDQGKVLTQLEPSPDGSWVIRAAVYANRAENEPIATGYAHEVIGAGMVNKTSALENCETSAIGRALANAGFATSGKRASREEMAKVQRADEPKPAAKKSAEPKPTGDISSVFAFVAEATTQAQLKDLWVQYKDILDEVMGDQSLRSYILQRKDEVES